MPTPEELAAQAAAATTAAPPANSNTGNAPGSEAQPATPTSGEKLFTQADFERELDQRLKRERSSAQAKADKAKADAEEADKVKQGEFQKLYEASKAQVEQLTSRSELADRLSEIFTKQLDDEVATWPEEAQSLVLPPESPLLQRIESADRARPIVQKLLEAQGSNGAAAPPPAPGLRFPTQHPGGGAAPVTTKTVAENTLNKAYAPRAPAKS